MLIKVDISEIGGAKSTREDNLTGITALTTGVCEEHTLALSYTTEDQQKETEVEARRGRRKRAHEEQQRCR